MSADVVGAGVARAVASAAGADAAQPGAATAAYARLLDEVLGVVPAAGERERGAKQAVQMIGQSRDLELARTVRSPGRVVRHQFGSAGRMSLQLPVRPAALRRGAPWLASQPARR